LDTHSGVGVRQRSHPHYLKGTVWCKRCGRRFIVQRAKGKSGGVYYYFFCIGRQDRTCDQPYIPVEIMEQAVITHYARVSFTEDFRAHVRAVVQQAAHDNRELSADMRDKLTKQLAKLDTKENYFLDLAAEEGWPKDKLREKIATIRSERRTITRSLDQAPHHLDGGIQTITLALDMLSDPQEMYRTGSEAVRTMMNRTIFTKLLVDGDTITDHELHEPFDVITEAYSAWQGYITDTDPAPRPSRRTGPRAALHGAEGTSRSSAAPSNRYSAAQNQPTSPALALLGQSSSKAVMVGDTGIEPVTSSVSGKRSPTELIARGGCGNRTRVQGFAGPCLSHSANPP
jgi:site-specific DNA recombinase